MSAAISELLMAGCIVQSNECPWVCSPLSVVENVNGRLRLVLDLRYVNQFLPEQKFKYEGLNLVPQMFEKGDHFFTFDLKSGYHHVDIHADFWTYLGFPGDQAAQENFTCLRYCLLVWLRFAMCLQSYLGC